VEPQGPKLAEGRDSEIFEHGPGLVLRRTFDGRSLVHEAEVMRHARAHGYPVPEVHDAGEGWLVMERVDGPTMLETATRPPFRLRRWALVLADLHRRLHEIPAPAWLPPARLPGDRVLHLDLHPLNVLLSDRGPVVIDWSNARRGDPALDLADIWVTFRCADVPATGLELRAANLGKRIFLRWFLRAAGREEACRALPAACEGRLADPNWTPSERERIRRLAEWASAKAPS
jgi:aminoglycoside phosphotransferase (APT) family kinase protein